MLVVLGPAFLATFIVPLTTGFPPRPRPYARWRSRNQPVRGAWVAFLPELRAIPDAQRVAALIEGLQRSGPVPQNPRRGGGR
ncbi:hypothetical protein SAMN04489732_101367 [Amycolatopsis saalfeldensis]|uniref:Uncharacterized protein n=1 Tax=Amycolatopsis saalfeldensis TaxID=394193 RepID=A0A1H8QIM3_9PSEU|nr:hypothetical protein SAMN04489732_101367 [Amycolatopsis saalfeldensis]